MNTFFYNVPQIILKQRNYDYFQDFRFYITMSSSHIFFSRKIKSMHLRTCNFCSHHIFLYPWIKLLLQCILSLCFWLIIIMKRTNVVTLLCRSNWRQIYHCFVRIRSGNFYKHRYLESCICLFGNQKFYFLIFI